MRSLKSFKRSILTSLVIALADWMCAAPIGTAINYQGYLTDKNKSATGLYDFTLKLYDAATGGSLAGSPNTINLTAVPVTNGLFSVALDFGATAFQGDARWLDISVAPNGSSTFTALTPRTQLRPGAYSLFATQADTAATANAVAANGVGGMAIQNSSITANKLAPGVVVNSINGLHDAVTLSVGAGLTLTPSGNTLTLGTSGGGWSLGGNSGTTAGVNFLGTTDHQPLELHAYGDRALRLASESRTTGSGQFQVSTFGINVLGGYAENAIGSDVIGATIAGGGFGFGNLISPEQHANFVGADFGSIGGGADNVVTAKYGVVPGGQNNIVEGQNSFAAGKYAGALHDGCFVWNDATAAVPWLVGGTFHYDNETTAANQFRVLASGGVYFRHGIEGVNIDQANLNNGGVNYSLRFGAGSGEAIGSKRTSGGNQWGLDFYTSFANRMTIQNDGSMRVYDNNIYLRGGSDSNHGLAYRNTVAGIFFDGPFLWGYNGGALGTVAPDEVSLAWDYVGNVWISNNCSVATLTIRGGADVAEPFQMTEQEIEKGSVVVIDEEHAGQLKRSTQAYDTRVAGIVSGANGIKPGIALKQEGALDQGENVALSGRVYVKADAGFGAIKPGDLLTTSPTPGHSMRVSDAARAQGAILGKAMSSLREGKGMVLVLVTLQ
jgi:hypothetical protein